jgi:hypothetical protein
VNILRTIDIALHRPGFRGMRSTWEISTNKHYLHNDRVTTPVVEDVLNYIRKWIKEATPK